MEFFQWALKHPFQALGAVYCVACAGLITLAIVAGMIGVIQEDIKHLRHARNSPKSIAELKLQEAKRSLALANFSLGFSIFSLAAGIVALILTCARR
jgi:hypothetical protein